MSLSRSEPLDSISGSGSAKWRRKNASSSPHDPHVGSVADWAPTVRIVTSEDPEYEYTTPLSASPVSPGMSSLFHSETLENVTIDNFLSGEALRSAIEHATVTRLNSGLTVIQDDIHLPSNVRIRGLDFFFRLHNADYREIVTCGTHRDHHLLTVAHGCREASLQCTIFISVERCGRSDLIRLVQELGARVIEVDAPTVTRLRDLDTMAVQYSRETLNCYYIQNGLNDRVYIADLAANFRHIREKYSLRPQAIWLASDHGVVSVALSRAFPEAVIHLVQVGVDVWDDVVKQIRRKCMHRYSKDPSSLYHRAFIVPPYPAAPYFDAKVWHFHNDISTSDLIWQLTGP